MTRAPAPNAGSPKQIPIRAATLYGPIALTILVLTFISVTQGPVFSSKLLGTALATFFFFGRFVILGGAEPEFQEVRRFFSPEFLFGLVVYMDAMVAMMFVFHAAFLFKIPWLGPRLHDLAKDGHYILRKNPWMRRAAFIGLIAFVAFPLAATGSVGGAILSRILGMPRLRAFFAIVAGSLLGCSLMYFGSQLINRFLPRDSIWTTVGGILVIVAIITFLNCWYRRLKSREEDTHTVDNEN